MNKRKVAKSLVVLALAWTVAFAAVAESQFGNREETALRPYKGFWRGVKAFTFNVVKSLERGNRKFPGLGVVEVGRGVRYGTVELLSSTYMGMMGSRARHYKDYSRPNEILDSDWLLRNTADTLGGAVFWAHGGSWESNLVGAAGVFTAQKVVDHSPVLSEREAQLYLQEKPRYTAQRRYVGRRISIGEDEGDVDFVRRARRQEYVVPTRPVLVTPPLPPVVRPEPEMAPTAPPPITVVPEAPQPVLPPITVPVQPTTPPATNR
jgi:hypothetical protein